MAKLFSILLIEDNVDDEQLSVRQLRRTGSSVVVEVAQDGEKGLSRLMDSQLNLPDLVLLDLRLPKISGLELLRQLRMNSRTSNLKVIVLSAPDEPDEIRTTYLQFADGFLHKPLSTETFLAEVARLGVVKFNASAL